MKKSKADSSIPNKTREGLSVEVITQKEAQEQVQAREIAKTMLIVDQYKGSVFKDHIGLTKTDRIKYNSDPKIKPTHPAHHQLPLKYKEKISNQTAL